MEARYFYQTALILYEKNDKEYTSKSAEWYLGLAQLCKPETFEYGDYSTSFVAHYNNEETKEAKEEVYKALMKIVGKLILIFRNLWTFVRGQPPIDQR
jgi:hypothetical protein